MIVSDASWPFSVHSCVSFNLEQWYMCKKDRPQNASESMEEGEDLMSTTFDSNQSKNILFFLNVHIILKQLPTKRYFVCYSFTFY